MGVTECRVAFVGAGAMAREHVRAFADVPGVVLTGIFSRTRQRAEQLARNFDVPYVCDSIQELHDHTGAHLVVIAVPELSSKATALAAFEFPWAVLMEKPPGLNLVESLEIQAAARVAGRRVFVALNRRALSSTRAAIADLDTIPGERFVHVQDQEDMPAARRTGQPEEVVRHWMYANSIHVVDLLRTFCRGEVTAVKTVLPWRGEGTRMMLAAVEFDSGDQGVYEGVWTGPGPWAVAVTTAQKRWELRPLEQAQYQDLGERVLRPVPQSEWDRTFKPGFRLQAEEVVDALHGRKSSVPSLDAAVDTMRLIRAIFEM